MATPRLFALLVIVMATVQLKGAEGSITCYYCSGQSGLSTTGTSYRNCGLPFYDNTTNSASMLPTVTCTGVCVTQTIYTLGSTAIYRSCSNSPVTDGCEYWTTTASGQQWSCISTCSTNNCNTGSDGTVVTPSAVVQLLVLAITAVVGRGVAF
jgi:hypothetical protein